MLNGLRWILLKQENIGKGKGKIFCYKIKLFEMCRRFSAEKRSKWIIVWKCFGFEMVLFTFLKMIWEQGDAHSHICKPRVVLLFVFLSPAKFQIYLQTRWFYFLYLLSEIRLENLTCCVTHFYTPAKNAQIWISVVLMAIVCMIQSAFNSVWATEKCQKCQKCLSFWKYGEGSSEMSRPNVCFDFLR